MRAVLRYGTFETNSSSEHTLVVFEDPAALELWLADSELFLDLRKADWTGESESPEVICTGFEDLIRKDGALWQDIMAERIAYHNDVLVRECGCEPASRIEDITDNETELAIGMNIVPAGYWSRNPWGGWGVRLSDYKTDDWSSDSAKAYAENGYDVLEIIVGDDH